MYIPISYWQTQGGGTPHMKAMYFSNTATSFNYNYNNITYTTSSIASRVIVPVCLDVTSNTAIEKGSILQAGASFFCSAQPSSNVVPCIEYTFYYDSIGCGFPGSATARYYDCSGNLVTRTVSVSSGVNTQFTACATSFGSQPCILTTATGNTCTSYVTTPSTCCISTPPQTGPQAWYIQVEYPRNTDLGTCYFNYIDENGNIINDSLTYAEYTKKILCQSNPLFSRSDSSFFDNFMKWTVLEIFPGQVLKYPYYNLPTKYTFTLKRDDPTDPGNYYFPYLTYFSGSTNASSYIGQIAGITSASLNATKDITANNPPIDASSPNNRTVPCVWITNAVPLQTALNLTSCETTNSLWVTLENYQSYSTGSVLKVTTPALTATSSCWTVTNLSQSFSPVVSISNVGVEASFATCYSCISGSLTSSLNVDYLLVAGGGAGGNGNSGNGPGAGGGAGGLLSGSYTLEPISTYNVIIGTGGLRGSGNAATGSNGLNSSVFGYTSIGGGGGGGNQKTGSAGGSGGGSGARNGTAISGGLATSGQGNIGGPGGTSNIYPGGGGGGASSAGTQWIFNAGPGYLSYAGSGGSGSQWLNGNYYAGGGAGGGIGDNGVNPGTPGIGGGGSGGDAQFATAATSGEANKGAGGGGGASFSPINAGDGSAGVCILRYPGTTQLIGGGNVSISGSYVYHTFTSSANIST